jgi:hypothetical protein
VRLRQAQVFQALPIPELSRQILVHARRAALLHAHTVFVFRIHRQNFLSLCHILHKFNVLMIAVVTGLQVQRYCGFQMGKKE